MQHGLSRAAQTQARRVLKMQLLLEQFVCPWCSEPLSGGIHMHEWLFKRGRVPNEIWTQKINCVLLHDTCHMEYGQSKAMTRKCYLFKVALGEDPSQWVQSLYSDGQIKVMPDMGFMYAELSRSI